MTSTRSLIIAAITPLAFGHGPLPQRDAALPVVQANDNRKAAGVLRDGVLSVRLIVGMARWYPEAANGPFVDVPAFAEEGKAPQIPAPLIRVPAGTIIDATIRNTLTDSTIYIRGFVTRPAKSLDSIPILPGESRTFRFAAGAAGDYAYAATPGLVNWDKVEREASTGAIIVDPPGVHKPDRVFVMNIWGDPDAKDTTVYRNALAINGKSWPYTERVSVNVGDTVRWHIVNATIRNHPMHLHGFYFRLDARGNALATTWLPPDKQALAVTEDMSFFSSMVMSWSPDRPGNWLFHCHIGFHVLPGEAELSGPTKHGSHEMAAEKHMAGLILGINVRTPPRWKAPDRGNLRTLHLFVNEGPRKRVAPRTLGYVLQNGATAPRLDSVELPGSVIVMTRDQPTDIVVVNRLKEPTSIHWHGVELESFSDGVPGWSGAPKRLAPVIAANDSFVAHLTLPRAGTFMYHTHLDDIEQLTSGLYGAIVVLEPGKNFDPKTDHVFVSGWDGPDEHFLTNGDTTGVPIEIAAGVPNRFRFVNIGPANRMIYAIRRDTTVQKWRLLAKDGADLPLAQQVVGAASRRINVGETFDAEFIGAEPGEYLLTVSRPNQPVPKYRQRIIVR